MGQQIALQLGDRAASPSCRRPFRRLDSTILRRQGRDRALQIADRRQVLVQARLVFRPSSCFADRAASSWTRVENAALAVDPARVPGAEQPVEQPVAESSPAAAARSGPAQLIFRWMLSPNDSCETPICSERNRESPPIFAATT